MSNQHKCGAASSIEKDSLYTKSLAHTIFDTPSFTPLRHTPSFTHRHRPSFTHRFVTHHLWHIIFHTPLCHTPSFTHNLWHTILHTPSFTTPSFTHTTLSQTIFPPPPPLSFLPSPSPLQNLLIIIGRSWLVGLWGPLTFFSIRSNSVLYAHHRHAAELHAPTGILYETIRCSSQVMDNAHVR